MKNENTSNPVLRTQSWINQIEQSPKKLRKLTPDILLQQKT